MAKTKPLLQTQNNKNLTITQAKRQVINQNQTNSKLKRVISIMNFQKMKIVIKLTLIKIYDILFYSLFYNIKPPCHGIYSSSLPPSNSEESKSMDFKVDYQ